MRLNQPVIPCLCIRQMFFAKYVNNLNIFLFLHRPQGCYGNGRVAVRDKIVQLKNRAVPCGVGCHRLCTVPTPHHHHTIQPHHQPHHPPRLRWPASANIPASCFKPCLFTLRVLTCMAVCWCLCGGGSHLRLYHLAEC